jgi:hypothetical protein
MRASKRCEYTFWLSKEQMVQILPFREEVAN